MKKVLALSLIVLLLLMLCDVPAISEPPSEDYAVYREYRDDLFLLQEDIARIYIELYQQKNLQAVYEHLLQVTEKTAVLIGRTEPASKDVHDALQISIQDHMELLLILGLSEDEKESLINLGYTEEDIKDVMTWLLHYNDYSHDAANGYTPEEIQWFYSLGMTDEKIEDLKAVVEKHYLELYTAQQMVKQHQTELLYAQVSLSVAALRILSELEKGKDKTGESEKGLLDAEENLLQAILDVSEDQSSLEHVKAFSKQVYKAAEREIRKGKSQYFADFFVGLQVHCGALAALCGNPEFGLAQIRSYEEIVSECVSPGRAALFPTQIEGQPVVLKNPTVSADFVGQVEEFDETNNLGVVYVFVKKPETSVLQCLILLSGFIIKNLGEAGWSATLPQLSNIIDSLFVAGVTAVSIVIGAIGAFLLLIVTAPSVGYDWPPAVPGWIEGDQVVIIVEGSQGQAHITERAKSSNPCTASSHQAILDDKSMITQIVVHASKLLYNEYTGQYIYYYVDNMGKEWGVFIEEYENKYYELTTAYRADCPPFKCVDRDGVPHEFYRIIEKWICEGFQQISLW